MPYPRSAALTAVFLVTAVLSPHASAAGRADSLESLRREAAKARDQLEKATDQMKG